MKAGYKTLILSLFSSLFLLPTLFAQEKLEDKINKIDGSIEKIIITSDGKEYLFEGSEAEELFKKMKKNSTHNLAWTTSDSEDVKKKVIIINSDGEKEVIEITSDAEDDIIIKTDKDFDSVTDGIRKKVKVEMENGNKKVTVTTNENGDEKTEVYEGDEADEYIEKMKSEHNSIRISIDEDKDGKEVKKIIIETESEEKHN